jgi:diguanylate cyclase (GGDEF)-like protein
MWLKKKTEVPHSYPAETLAESNARLMQKVVQLEQDVAEARHLAYHDALTGLPNRALLLDRMKQAIMQAQRQKKAVGVLLLDLDRFKSVNDELGHNGGDLVLQEVAARLSGCVRGCDTACRYGGDEFVILLPEIRGTEDVEAVKQKVSDRLAIPHRIYHRVVAIGASIGTALFTEGAASCGELIGAADAAMYRAKRQRIGSLRVGAAIDATADGPA